MFIPFLSLLLTFLLLYLSACGPTGPNAQKPVDLDPADLPELLENLRFSCAPVDESTPCPDGLARIFVLNSVDPSESTLCSGFLIRPNILVTNHHCVSDEVQCSDTLINVHVQGKSVSARCQHLLAAEDDGPNLITKSVDFAVLKLDRPIELPEYFRTADKSPRLGDGLHVWVMDHLEYSRARITELRCTYGGRRSSLELQRCPAILGNSGSPVLNQRGELTGILWGTTFDDRIDESTPLNVRRSSPVKSFFTEQGYFSHFLD